MNNLKPNNRLVLARLKLVKDIAPYLATALWAMKPIAKEGIGTFGVDAWWRLYYDPKLVDDTNPDAWSVNGIAAALYHEVNHLLRSHNQRRNSICADPQIWNLASDASINPQLIEEGVVLPIEPIVPENYGLEPGGTAEAYYISIMERAVRVKCAKCAGGDGKVPSKEKGQIVIVEHDDPACAGPGAGRCGSCGGKPEAWEEGPPTSENEGVSEPNGELIRRQVAADIQARQKEAGDVPGSWLRYAEEKLHSKVDWRKELQALVRQGIIDIAGMVNYSFKRPSRRQSAVPGIVLPSMRKPVPNIAIVIDTSGSMTDKMLAQGLAEIEKVLESNGFQGVPVLSVDTRTAVNKKVFSVSQVELGGGGGTDMRIGIRDAMALNPKPDMIILISDGFSPFDDTAPPAKLIVALTDEDGRGHLPSYARVILIEPD
jgi:predicted metal-dependent peptidase